MWSTISGGSDMGVVDEEVGEVIKYRSKRDALVFSHDQVFDI